MAEMKPVRIPLKGIKDNKLNNRSMNDDDIKVLGRNIDENGLQQQICVYKDDDGLFTILSGHKRVHALRLNHSDDYEVPCNLQPKPADEWEEQEILIMNNIGRKLDTDIKQEIFLAHQNYESMPPERRKAKAEVFKERFIQKYKDYPAYIEDPKKFVSNNFKPKCDYIRELTSLDYSNTTIKRYLNEILPKNEKLPEGNGLVFNEGNNEEVKKETKKKDKSEDKKIGKKDIIRSIQSLSGLLKIYEPESEVEEVRCNSLRDELENLLDYYKS